MKAMILAAGRGERMKPLTDQLPKPLIPVRGKPLIRHHIENLKAAGVRQIVVNLGWLGDLLRQQLGDGSQLGVQIVYSEEGWPALETGGGVFRALPLLGPAPFLLVNGDVYTDYPMPALVRQATQLSSGTQAHLVLVPNPAHNPAGDFTLEDGCIRNSAAGRLTFSGLSVQRPELFADCKDGRFPILPLWRTAADRGQVSGEFFSGTWSDVGTPGRLAALETR